MTIVHTMLWNQWFDKFEVGDTHLWDMLYSNWINRYTCARSHKALLQVHGLVASLDNLLAWWTRLQVIYWLHARWSHTSLVSIFFLSAWLPYIIDQCLTCAQSPPWESWAYLISAMWRHPNFPKEKWWGWVPIWLQGMCWSGVRNQVVSTLVWLWWVIDLPWFEFKSGIFQLFSPYMFMWRIVFACLVVCRWQMRHGGQW
jgi:hypothetical protein